MSFKLAAQGRMQKAKATLWPIVGADLLWFLAIPSCASDSVQVLCLGKHSPIERLILLVLFTKRQRDRRLCHFIS